MTSTERMLDRMRSELAVQDVSLPSDAEIRRTYAGWAQRSCGAWSWFTWSPSGAKFTPWNVHDVGSCYPVYVLLRCKNWSTSVPRKTNVMHIDPCEVCIRRFGHKRF